MFKSLLFWLKAALFVVPAAYAANFWYALHTDQAGGTFGDTFGAANALFSGAALMMLVYAVILQRNELDLVKEERNDTRRLLEGQEKITAAQKFALDQQLFEQSFNSLLAVALTEKARLSSRIMLAGDRLQFSIFAQAKRAAHRMMHDTLNTSISGQEIQKDDWSETDIETVKKVSFYITLLIHLEKYVEEKAPSEDSKTRMRKIIASLVDHEVAASLISLLLHSKVQNQNPEEILTFINNLKLQSYFKDEETAALQSWINRT